MIDSIFSLGSEESDGRPVNELVVSPCLYSNGKTCFCHCHENACYHLIWCEQTWGGKNPEKHETVEHCASSPTEPVFDFCLYLLCEKGISLYIRFENAFELHHCTVRVHVCVCVTIAKPAVTWYYGRLSHVFFVFLNVFCLSAESWRLGWVSWEKKKKLNVLDFLFFFSCYVRCVSVYDCSKHPQPHEIVAVVAMQYSQKNYTQNNKQKKSHDRIRNNVG